MLYSVVRLSPDRQTYDVPVVGDWITIAVVAERGQVQVSNTAKGSYNNFKSKAKAKSKAKVSGEESQEDDNDEDSESHDKKKSKPGQPSKSSSAKPVGKKHMMLRLVDFGHRASGSATGGKRQICGDALLNMLLFEADSFAMEKKDGLSERVYKGGSGGAFERCARMREGTVLAIMNPKIMKPFQVSTLSFKRDIRCL